VGASGRRDHRDAYAQHEAAAASPVEVPILSEEQVRALLVSCRGSDFEDRRNYAIIYTLLDAGRLSELTGLRVEDDVDLKTRTLSVLGKGRKPRIVGIGAQATQALDRYIRIRRSHPQAHRPELWIGKKGKLTGSGVRQILERRDEAGIQKCSLSTAGRSALVHWALRPD
jgi:site-specific recombinase XerC